MTQGYKGLGFSDEDIASLSASVSGTTLTITATLKDGTEVTTTATLPTELPTGGTAGQVLTKTASGSEWADASGGGGLTVITISGNSGTFTVSEGIDVWENPQNYVFLWLDTSVSGAGFEAFTYAGVDGQDTYLYFKSHTTVDGTSVATKTLSIANDYTSWSVSTSSGETVLTVSLDGTATTGGLTSAQRYAINNTPQNVIIVRGTTAFNWAESDSTNAYFKRAVITGDGGVPTANLVSVNEEVITVVLSSGEWNYAATEYSAGGGTQLYRHSCKWVHSTTTAYLTLIDSMEESYSGWMYVMEYLDKFVGGYINIDGTYYVVVNISTSDSCSVDVNYIDAGGVSTKLLTDETTFTDTVTPL